MDELLVLIPANNVEERTWIIKTIVADFLLIPCKVEISDTISDYMIVWGDQKIVIADFFFSLHKKPLSYLQKESIPKQLNWFNDLLFTNDKLAIVYGKNELIVSDKEIYCGLDIFASAFFMLSRWEEAVIEKKDKFGRCDENEMFVVKHNIYERPIVNEYVELLRLFFQHIGIPLPNEKRHFGVYLTHDIDDLFRCASLKNFCKNIAGDILHRKSISALASTLKRYVKFKLGQIKDPFDTFDDLMDLSDRYGFKNAFYFKASFLGEFDATYDIRDVKVKKIINNIINRGYEVGFHPSKNTFHCSGQFKIEIERLRKICSNVRGGRQHFLLYDIPNALRSWNDTGLEYDAGLGFASMAGFRCGICYAYPFFDIYERKQLNLIIRPLIVMEGALFENAKYGTLESVELYMKSLANVVYDYQGDYVFLWHNDNFHRPETEKYGYIYKNIIDYLGSIYGKN